MLLIAVGLGTGFGLFCLWIYLTGSRHCNRRLCPVVHEVGPITVRHFDVIDCGAALNVGKAAEMVWRRLDEEFPGQREGFRLEVIFDPARATGSRLGERIMVNLHDCASGDEILDTLAEELRHLREARAGIEPEFVFPIEDVWSPEDVVLYYALNEHEYRALCFAVSLVGCRRRLLVKVEEYRALHRVK